MALDDFRLYFYCFTNVCTQWVSQVFTIISNPRTPWNQCLSSGPQSVLWVLTHGLSLAAAPRFSSAVLMGKLLGFTEGLRNKKCETKGGKTVGCPASLGIGSCDEMSRISFLVKFQVLAPLLPRHQRMHRTSIYGRPLPQAMGSGCFNKAREVFTNHCKLLHPVLIRQCLGLANVINI